MVVVTTVTDGKVTDNNIILPLHSTTAVPSKEILLYSIFCGQHHQTPSQSTLPNFYVPSTYVQSVFHTHSVLCLNASCLMIRYVHVFSGRVKRSICIRQGACRLVGL